MTVKSFETADEMFEHLEQEADKAKEAFEKQGSPVLAVGTKYRKISEYGLVIYGEVLDEMKIGFPDGEPTEDEELAEYWFEKKSILESRARGYIFIRAYSEVCQQGEMGTTHVTGLKVISDAEFEDYLKFHDWG